MSINSSPLSVFEFTHYHEYLYESFLVRKASQGYTLQELSDDLLLNHKTKALRLVKGQIKNLSFELTDRISDYHHHSDSEREYFRTLVSFNEAETIDKKNEFFEKMHRIIRPQNRGELIEEQRKYFSKWQYPVIKELITSQDSPSSISDLSSRLIEELSLNEISSAIDDLVNLGVIYKEGHSWKCKDLNLTLEQEEMNGLLLDYHLQNISLLRSRFEQKVHLKELFGHSITLGAPKERIPEFKRKLQEHYEELLDLGATLDEGKESVWQFCMYLYPMTK